MSAASFAFLDLNAGRFAQLVVNVLAVGGGFLAGFLGTGFVAWLLDRWLTGGKSPQGLKRACKTIGGVIVAVLIALMLFGHGSGWNLLGGGGPGDDNGASAPKGDGGDGKGGTPPAPAPAPPPPDVPPVPPPRTYTAPEDRVKVTLLGGEDVKEMRFYVLDDDPAPRALADVKAAVAAKRDAAMRPVGLEVRFDPKFTLPPSHPAVLQLTNWAHENKIPYTFPAPRS